MKTHDTQRVCGEAHPKAKLTDAQVNALRDAYETEQPRPSMRKLAARFGCPYSTVWDILTYHTRTLTRVPLPTQ